MNITQTSSFMSGRVTSSDDDIITTGLGEAEKISDVFLPNFKAYLTMSAHCEAMYNDLSNLGHEGGQGNFQKSSDK